MKTPLKMLVVLLGLSVIVPGTARAGWYVGAGVGNSESALDVGFDLPPDSESDDSGFAWGVFGGYEFSPLLAMEFGYEDLGDDYEMFNVLGNDERIQIDAAEIDVSLVGRIKVHERAHLFGRLGVTLWEAELSYTEPGFDSSDDDMDLDAMIGLGFEWEVGRILGIRFEWKQYQNLGDEVKTDLPPGTGGRLELNGSDISVLGVAATFSLGG